MEDMSRRVMSILSTYSPQQEIYSIDECFLDFSGMSIDFREYGLKMKLHVEKWTGIPISIGIAATKALAKAANRIAKKFPERTEGCHVIDTEEKRIKALKWIDVEDVWGIGRRNAAKLRAIGVRKACDFVNLSPSWVQKYMTVTGLSLQKELNGIPSIPMELPEKDKILPSHEPSMPTKGDVEEIRGTHRNFHEHVCPKSCAFSSRLPKNDGFPRNEPFQGEGNAI